MYVFGNDNIEDRILSKERKDVYLSGDFNVDLLKLESIVSYNDFYNILLKYVFLPQIINPTRITETTKSVIDNIYTNCMEFSQKVEIFYSLFLIIFHNFYLSKE